MSSMKLLCRYQYDPLDRLTGLKPLERSDTQRFYQGNDLVNEIEGQEQLTIMRNEAQPLAQRHSVGDVTKTTLLATDQQHSVLQTRTTTDTHHLAYTAYGHHPVESGLSSLLGFNGERRDSVTGHYLLGQGNRAFNPVLMRFNSPDELSPFGDGGINAYAYCGGDPVNWHDPSGNIPSSFRPWNIFNKSKIFNPWEKPNAFDLSSKPTSLTVFPEQLPFEGSARAPKSQDRSRTQQREYQYNYLQEQAEYARRYDLYREAGIELKLNPVLLNKFSSAKEVLTKLQSQMLPRKKRTPAERQAQKAAREVRNNAFAKVQKTRWRVKYDAVKNYEKKAGIIRTQ
ncbi:RHS repeat-associated core domain-containing protein [Pseudomonas sp. G166]|uniref:RHS repeat-associated core domain-containing protein n=1 Tax=Pseudomonas sp. G166 TaxID=3094846 RepID=UPI003008D98F